MWPDQAVARENVRRLLFEQAMTAKSLAEQTGIASSTIYNWLRDSAPGTYRNRTAGSCYWERLKGFGGSLDEIEANSASRGPIVVTILQTDKGFHSRGCGVLSQDLSAITPSPASPFGDGTYIVNTDVAPGRWRSDGTGSCYWERLKSFGGTLDEIITNNASTGPSIVEIAPGDRGFHSSGCGKWTKN